MLRLALLLIGLGGTAALAADLEGRSAFPRQILVASMAVGGSFCGFAAVQTAFRLGRLTRNREALQPREPTSSCLVEAWRWVVGAAAFLMKAGLGIACWALVFEYFKSVLR